MLWEASGSPERGLVGEGQGAWCTEHSGLLQGTFVVGQPRASCSLLLICDRSGRGRVHQENVRAWSKAVLNAPGPPRGVVVPMVHLVHSDPL